MILLHIVCALLSLVVASWAALVPTRAKLRAGYSLTALTLSSGTYLVMSRHAPLVSSCLAGLFYLSLVAAGLLRAKVVAAQKLD